MLRRALPLLAVLACVPFSSANRKVSVPFSNFAPQVAFGTSTNPDEVTSLIQRQPARRLMFPSGKSAFGGSGKTAAMLPGVLDGATCYTMRTYNVKRSDRHSDVTVPSGYSTCQLASQFQIRTSNAVMHTPDEGTINLK